MPLFPRIALGSLFLIGFGLLLAHLTAGHTFALIETKGLIATRERNLMLTALLLMLVIVLPVLILTFAIAWRYRADNQKAAYTPNWDHSLLAETIWWGIPCLVIGALAIITWNSTHQLDSKKALAASGNPLTIQVVALPWKWLFIYPTQQVASVNEVYFPTDTAVHFEITSDAPMNSFSIPQLSGQIYAMPGMTTDLNIVANHDGTYRGQSANLSGTGFAGMSFRAISTSEADFSTWVSKAKKSSPVLSTDDYEALAKPSQNVAASTFNLKDRNLYGYVLQKYMPAMQMSK